MKAFFTKWAVHTAALLLVVWIVPGISAAGWDSLIMASLVLGLLNTFIRPVILALTLPLQVFSLGLATLALNALLFLL
ncbi:MAG: phage holin family protein, partial [Candidatus Omnitrophota bacterium]|nr:phage holin family protein [Candidatus Omnitrophota bacterium]